MDDTTAKAICKSLIDQYDRYLDLLRSDIEHYPETELWKVQGTVNNSPGNLCLHLIGNLNHFIGHGLGKSGYERNRPAEFDNKDVPAYMLLQGIDQTKRMLQNLLMAQNGASLAEPYPLSLDEYKAPYGTLMWLQHLAAHLSYHAGQVNYNRRLLHA